MPKIGNISFQRGLFLAPMEDITDRSFRLICKGLGADLTFTEFVNAEGLVRNSEKTHKKLRLEEREHPIGIQIYGSNLDSMVKSAQIAEEQAPDLIDINAGCWVRNVVGCGAGAALVKDPEYLQKLTSAIVMAVKVPVTVKTRIGWDSDSITILEIARRVEEAGAAALTIHCRTRAQGHSGDPNWSYIEKVKDKISIPVVLNGGVMLPEDAGRAFNETPADAVMIARGAINNPWIFLQAKEMMNGRPVTEITPALRVETCLKHLQLATEVKGERRAVLEHRKFYSGYLKGLRNASQTRAAMMTLTSFTEVEEKLMGYLHFLQAPVQPFI